jgi:hypothetical protein
LTSKNILSKYGDFILFISSKYGDFGLFILFTLDFLFIFAQCELSPPKKENTMVLIEFKLQI